MEDFKTWKNEKKERLEFMEGDYKELKHQLSYLYKKIFISGKVEEFNGEYWIGEKTINSVVRKLESRLGKDVTLIILPRKVRDDK